MSLSRSIVWLALTLLLGSPALGAEPPPTTEFELRPLTSDGGWEYNIGTGIATGTNGVLLRYGTAVLTANRLQWNTASGDVVADGGVRIQQGEQIWASEHLRYNVTTREIEAEQFRTGLPPLFAAGEGLHAEITNNVYVATNAVMTTDDVADPAMMVRAKRVTIIPGKKIKAANATLYVGKVPVFYFPYYSRNLGEHANNFNFTPGYRSLFGPFVLGNYTWYLNDELDGILHLDYREKRGVGLGPELNYDIGRWGKGTLNYYYTHDHDPNADGLDVPIPKDRQRLFLSYQASPATNFYVSSLVRYESDAAMVRDFFEGEYRRNPQPDTFVEANKFWSNFSVDAYVQPRVNDFLETVERLPDLRITGFRQQLGSTPLYYESETSAGYYRRLFAEDAGTNGPPSGDNYQAARADTYHKLLLPQTFFGWLNVAPRVGGRFTYYGEASGPGGFTDEQYRGVLDTGAEVSFKASRLWPDVQSRTLDLDGLRHIIQPSADYVFVPHPTARPSELPQFDYELPSLRLLPNQFPDYNNIDSIDSRNVIRWGLQNKLQTKRAGQVVNLLSWDVYTDWRVERNAGQTTFSDLYSDFNFKPRSWLTFESLTRYDIHDGLWRMSYTTVTIQPNNVWSWRLGQYYLRDDLADSTTALGIGNNVFTSTLYYRLNENWGFRMAHYFEARTGRLQEQSYSVYRDLRSWTAALSFLIRDNPTGPQDYTVAFTFSLKAFPRFGLGHDTTGPYSLLSR